MGSASFVQSAFTGGEVSQAYQGRIDKQDYRTFMNACLNSIVTEGGDVRRRGGSRHCGRTRLGRPGRVIAFDFKQIAPIQMEFTDGYLRFWSGFTQIGTNDTQTVLSINAATPAVVQVGSTPNWPTGSYVYFPALLGSTRLQGREFLITNLSPSTFQIFDAQSGDPVDGSVLDPFAAGSVRRVLEIVTPYTAGSWASLRSVQAERKSVLLNGTAPQVLDLTADLVPGVQMPEFSLEAANFLDGPYLDPFPGSWITSSAVNGVVTLTLTFQPYDAARAYNEGDYVASGGQGYRSLTNANQGNAPPAAQWLAVNGGDPINGGAGVTEADIGRLLRLFSEPQLWASGTTFAADTVVAYQVGSGAASYWKNTSGGNLTGVVPGTTTGWSPLTPGAIWTWAKITGIANTGVVNPDSEFGSLTGGGGVTVLFDGSPSKAIASAANSSQAVQTAQGWQPIVYGVGAQVQTGHVIYQKIGTYLTPPGFPPYYETQPPSGNPLWAAVGATSDASLSGYGGGHYAVGKSVQNVTVYPPNDTGFAYAGNVTLNLRGKATAPASSGDGTLLGSTGVIANTGSPVSIVSSDNATAWNYIWIEVIGQFVQPLPDDGTHSFTCRIGLAQIVVYSPNIANGSQITAQILGDALLYSGVTMRKWRLGAYGGSNGWPTCGTYSDGRLWLSGAIANRVDAGKPIDTNGELFNFAPTAPDGTVAADNAIAATFDAPDVNAIVWMHPDQQGILCGTQAGEWLVDAPAQGGIGPTNVRARRVTRAGCANMEPRRTDHTLVVVQKYQRKVLEFFADVISGKFSAPNLSDKSRHLTVPGISEIAYQQELAPIVWARLDSGNLVGWTYKRDTLMTSQGPGLAAAHRHVLGSGRSVESISVGPSTGGNLESLSMVTNEAATNIHHVEIMTDMQEEGFSQAALWYLDDAIAPSTVSVVAATVDMPYGGLQINGLWNHNGKTVAVFASGLDCGATTDAVGQPTTADFTVVNGSVTVPFGDGVSGGSGNGLFTLNFLHAITSTLDLNALNIVVGFPYNSDGQIVRPAQQQESGARAGPALGKERRIDRYAAQLYGAITGTISFSTSFDHLFPALFNKQTVAADYTVLSAFSGIYRDQPFAESDFDNMLCWRQSRPNAGAFMIALGGRVETQD